MAANRLEGAEEENLIQAIRMGKQEAFGLLYDAYAPVLMGMISRMIPQTEVAEEVLKETFLTIWSRTHIFDPSQSRFLTWALAIGRGVALEAQKTGKYGHLIANKAVAPSVSETETEKHLLGTKLEKEAFCQLEPQERAIITLIYLKGYSCPQAAEALGISEGLLKRELKQAFKHLAAEKTA